MDRKERIAFLSSHHQATIPMANAVLERTNNPTVERLANAIVDSQEAEIEIMQALLSEMDAAPVEEDEGMDMEGMDMSEE